MTAIIRTWPSVMPRKRVIEVFNHDWGQFYFTLGKGKPAQAIDQLWWTHQGEILGYFKIATIVRNLGDNLPKLRSISGETSEWQIRLMNWVAVCDPPFHALEEEMFHEAFRGWRYFAIESYRKTMDAKVRI